MDSDKEDPGGGDERMDTSEVSQENPPATVTATPEVPGDPDGVTMTMTPSNSQEEGSPGGRHHKDSEVKISGV